MSAKPEDLKYAKDGGMYGLLYVKRTDEDEIFPIFVYDRKDFNFICKGYKGDTHYNVVDEVIISRFSF